MKRPTNMILLIVCILLQIILIGLFIFFILKKKEDTYKETKEERIDNTFDMGKEQDVKMVQHQDEINMNTTNQASAEKEFEQTNSIHGTH